MIDIETITPQQLLLMPVDEYLRTFGNKKASKRALAILCTKLLKMQTVCVRILLVAVHCQKTENLFVSVTSFVFHIHTSTKRGLDRTAFTLSVRLWREMSLD